VELTDWIEAERRRFEVPGLAVAVVQGADVAVQQGFGLRDRDRNLPVETTTSFPIASVTKAFTAALVGALVDDGLLEWDRPVRQDIVGFQMYDPVATERTTPRDLLSHRTGLPRHDIVWYHAPPMDRAEVVRRLRHLEPSKDFRTTWQYNNLCYLAAGHLCEVVTGETWEELVRTRLFDALGMKSSGFDFGETSEPATPYAERQGELQAVRPYTAASVAPAGAIHATITDLTRWLQCILGKGELDGNAVLSADTVSQLLKPHTVMTAAGLFPEVADSSYGLGWFIGSYRGHKLVHHGGNIDGATSLVTMLPDEGIGIAFLSNRGGTMLRAALSYHVFDALLGLESRPWEDKIHAYEKAVSAGAREAKARGKEAAVPGTSPSHPLADYAGSYTHPAYGTIEVAVSGDGAQLVPSWRGLDAQLVHRHYDVFDLEVPELETSRIAIRFTTDADGYIEAFSAPFETLAPPAVFAREPEPIPEEVLAALPGAYAMGAMTITIEVRGEGPDRKLVASGTGLAGLVFVPHRGRVLRLEGIQDGTATVVLDEDGRVRELLLLPLGVFLPVVEPDAV
jgi:CubicO group peptidase (beta-lactamase class C family)